MSASGGDAAVSKLLGKLRESQDLFDNLENLFDTKVRDAPHLASARRYAESPRAFAAAAPLLTYSQGRAPSQLDTPLRVNLTSPPNLSVVGPTSLPPTVPLVPVVSPAAPPAPTPSSVEASLLHERMRQMQAEHAAQLRAHTEATEKAVRTRVEQEVLTRVTSHSGVVDQMREEMMKQREESLLRIQDLQHDLERSRDNTRRAEEQFRDTLAIREREVADDVEVRMHAEVRARDEKIQAVTAELEKVHLDAEDLLNEVARKEQSLKVANEAVKELKEQHDTAILAMGTLNAKHHSNATETQRMQSSLQLVTESRTQLEKEYEQLQASYDQQTVTLKQVKEDADRKREAYETVKSEFLTLKRQVQDVHGVNEIKATEMAQLSLDMTVLQNRLDDQTARAERQLKQQQRELEQNFDERRQQLQAEVKAKVGRIHELESRADDLTHQLEVQKTVSLQLKQQQQRNSELEVRLQEKDRELTVYIDKSKHSEELTVKLNAAEVREMTLEEKVRELKNSFSDKERDLQAASVRVQACEDLRIQINSAEVRTSSLIKRERELSEKLRQKEVEWTALQEKVRVMDEVKLKLLGEVATLRAQNETLRTSEGQSKELGREREKELAACRDEMNKAALELTRRHEEIVTLKGTVSDVQSLRDDSVKLSETKEYLRAREERIESLSQDLAKAQLLCSQKDREYETLVQEYDTKEEEYMQQSATLSAAEEELREFVRVREELQLARASLEELQMLYDRREVGIQQQTHALTTGCENVAEEHLRLQSDYQKMEERLEEALQRNEHLGTLLSHKEFLVDEKNKELEAGGDGEASLRQWMHDKVARVSEELSGARAERDEALHKLSKSRADITTRQQDLAIVEQTNHELRELLEQRDVRDVRADFDESEVEALRLEVDHLKGTILDLQQRMRDAENDRTKCEEKLVYVGTQLNAERKQVSALKESNQALIGQMNEKDSDVAHQAANALEKQQLQLTYEALVDEHAEVRKTLKQKEQQLDATERRNKELELQVRTAHTNEERLRRRIAELETDRTDEPPTPSRAPAPHASLLTSEPNLRSMAVADSSGVDLSQSGRRQRGSSLFIRAQQSSVARLSESGLGDVLGIDSPSSAATQRTSHSRPSKRGEPMSVVVQRTTTNIVPDPSEPPASAHTQQDTPRAHGNRRGSSFSKRLNATTQSMGSDVMVQQLDTTQSSGPSVDAAELTEEDDDKARPSLGVQLVDDGAARCPHPRVQEVKTGGPAYTAGMRKGDFLKSLALHPLSTARDLERILGSIEPGEVVDVTFVRVKHGSESEFDSKVRVGSTGGRDGRISKRGSVTSMGSRNNSLSAKRRGSGAGLGLSGVRASGSRASSAAGTPQTRSLPQASQPPSAPLPSGKWM